MKSSHELVRFTVAGAALLKIIKRVNFFATSRLTNRCEPPDEHQCSHFIEEFIFVQV